MLLFLPFFFSYIFPLFVFSYFNNFEIGNINQKFKYTDLFEVIPVLIFITFTYLLLLKSKIKFAKLRQFSNFQKLNHHKIITLIVISIIGGLSGFVVLLNLQGIIKQVSIQLSFLPLICLIYLNLNSHPNYHKTTKLILLIIFLTQCLMDFFLTSITRDVLTKLIILICCLDYTNIKKKNIIIFFLFIIFLFLTKDYLRKNFDNIYFDDVSIDDFKINQNIANDLDNLIDIDNPNLKGYHLIELTNEYNIYGLYKSYFNALNIEVIVDNSDERSLCDRKDPGCLTFKDFYKRIIDISKKEEIESNSSRINIFNRLNKLSSFAFYKSVMGESKEYLKFKLYYPQIYTILPIPRSIWKEKPINENGDIIGNYFSFNTIKSGSIGWYEPMLIELFISFGYIGYFIYICFNFTVIVILFKLRSKNQFYKPTSIVLITGLLKFYFDYHVQGFVGSIGGVVYFYFVYLILYLIFKYILINRSWLRG